VQIGRGRANRCQLIAKVLVKRLKPLEQAHRRFSLSVEGGTR
jgi:hypothetical protein